MPDTGLGHADPGSYRDPLSRVFVVGSEIYRGLRGDGVADYEAFEASPLFRAAIDAGQIVGTRRAEAPEDLGDDHGWELFLHHDRVPFVSYPYEWTFSMRREAALLQLDLAGRALNDGLITKDATPYNVVFNGAAPQFIDIGSFERLHRGEPWYGYQQFCRMNLYPLMFQAHLDLDPRPWLRGSLDGISATDAWRLLSGHKRKRGVLNHVGLQARAERAATAEEPEESRIGPALIAKQIEHLTRTVEGLSWSPPESTWSGYGERGHYEAAELGEKEAFVAAAVGTGRRLVVDLGANDGRFSRIARQGADLVVASDIDATVVERLHRTLVAESTEGILPLLIDLVDPSPAQGWRVAERASFAARCDADVVLALALVHHLAITRSVPIDQVVDQLAELGRELVLEIPHRDDPMVALLLSRKRAGLYDQYSVETFEAAVHRRFVVAEKRVLAAGTRTLLHAHRR